MKANLRYLKHEMAWAVVSETGKQWNAMRDNIKIGEDPADGLDRKMKNSRSNLMKQKKKIQGYSR